MKFRMKEIALGRKFVFTLACFIITNVCLNLSALIVPKSVIRPIFYGSIQTMMGIAFVYYSARLYYRLNQTYYKQFYFYKFRFKWYNALFCILNVMYIVSIKLIYMAEGKIYTGAATPGLPTLMDINDACKDHNGVAFLSALNYLCTNVFQFYNLLTTILLIFFKDTHLLLDDIEDLFDMIKVSYFMVYKDSQYQMMKEDMIDSEPIMPTGAV